MVYTATLKIPGTNTPGFQATVDFDLILFVDCSERAGEYALETPNSKVDMAF